MKYEIILASGSPRRKEILSSQGISFSVQKAVKEEVTTETLPNKVVRELSEQKALEVYDRLENDSDVIIIAADTIVSVSSDSKGDEPAYVILGKPQDEADAVRMLSQLQGNTHQVYTGVTVMIRESGKSRRVQFEECTDVTMYPMSDEEIRGYVDTKEPMDKAGAYAIQGKCARYIASIKGDYLNVVGLPMARLYQELKRNGVVV